MIRSSQLGLVCILLAVGFAISCKPKRSAESPYFQTPFQTESQFIVQAIVSDLAEQTFYATSHQMPDKKLVSVTTSEKAGSPLDAPVFELQIHLDKKRAVKLEVTVDGPIWSPVVYHAITAKLAGAAGLSRANRDKSEDTSLLSKLLDGTAETIEQENQKLSAALEKDFSNAELHEKAAVLLGAFLLREHSGKFFELRSPLSRITAHLAMAHFLRGSDSYGINGQMAETIMLMLVNNGGSAVEKLNKLGTNDVAVAAMSRALRARCTGDYRLLDKAKDRSPVENVAWFLARGDYLSRNHAVELRF